MSHRDPSVYLSPVEPRCSPSALPQCGRFTCARYLAPVPPSGAAVVDYNLTRDHFSAPCSMWVSMHNKPLQQPPVPRKFPPITPK